MGEGSAIKKTLNQGLILKIVEDHNPKGGGSQTTLREIELKEPTETNNREGRGGRGPA